MNLLAIDAGNTRIKVAIYQNEKLEAYLTVSHTEDPNIARFTIDQLCKDTVFDALGIANVSQQELGILSELKYTFQKSGKPIIEIHGLMQPLPFQIAYDTPQTLGADRLAAIAGAFAIAQGKPILVIDVGSCITYDYLSAEEIYLGGGISPGLEMRFNALYQFTARLPQLSPVSNSPLVGKTTEECIRSGVQNGIIAELNGMIQQYRAIAGEELVTFLTGGDARFFEKQIENLNFAVPNLVLDGIRFLAANNLQ
ncbi:MAG: type III pantothenate kinase [Bacteroidia bacterium]|nr:type III pantothenate kinase [Bacteroidia bacterium]